MILNIKNRSIRRIFGVIFCCFVACHLFGDENESWVRKHYIKREVMIPMRDGTHLYTAIYEPEDLAGEHPVLLTRTPYKASPYGTGFDGRLWRIWGNYARDGYIFVIQDVRGRGRSEGEFVNVRPMRRLASSLEKVDESTDVYDTVEWLLQNTTRPNGRVGIIGSSYSGFYAIMGAYSNHSAIKAVVPQAPVTDWFLGDDYHHNGALMLCDGFRFCSSMNRPRPASVEFETPYQPYYKTDEYTFFLHAGAVRNLTALLGDSISFWTDVVSHPNYDAWWQARDTRRSCRDVKPAVLVVGGLFDAEDCYGAWELYKTLREKSPATDSHLIMGPWSHGAWNGTDGSYLGNVRFGSKTALYYREQVEYPFLRHYLVEGDTSRCVFPAVASVFFSGENCWREFTSWPSPKSCEKIFYLREGGRLSESAPKEKMSRSSYVSDPSKPVPYTDRTVFKREKEYMTGDQRFAERRPDVLSFKSDPFATPLTLAGAVEVELEVALSTTDADFVVKVIDEFPEDFVYDKKKDGKGSGRPYLMCGYQMLVRGDLMRGRYRDSFEYPKAFLPNKVTKVRFVMPDIAHTFGVGHRLVIQVQSSWFPLFDRNPQRYVNIYTCGEEDFVKSTVTLYHERGHASRICFRQLPD